MNERLEAFILELIEEIDHLQTCVDVEYSLDMADLVKMDKIRARMNSLYLERLEEFKRIKPTRRAKESRGP